MMTGLDIASALATDRFTPQANERGHVDSTDFIQDLISVAFGVDRKGLWGHSFRDIQFEVIYQYRARFSIYPRKPLGVQMQVSSCYARTPLIRKVYLKGGSIDLRALREKFEELQKYVIQRKSEQDAAAEVARQDTLIGTAMHRALESDYGVRPECLTVHRGKFHWDLRMLTDEDVRAIAEVIGKRVKDGSWRKL